MPLRAPRLMKMIPRPRRKTEYDDESETIFLGTKTVLSCFGSRRFDPKQLRDSCRRASKAWGEDAGGMRASSACSCQRKISRH
jgi:hypothetical protein